MGRGKRVRKKERMKERNDRKGRTGTSEHESKVSRKLRNKIERKKMRKLRDGSTTDLR
jgi:hypothetical protein